MAGPAALRWPRARGRVAAFTLVELLLAAVFSSILLAGLLTMALSLLRAGVREDNQQTAQDAWARVNQFLLIEVGEAGRFYVAGTEISPIVLNGAITECSAATKDSGSESFSIRVPNPDQAATVRYRTISYYVTANNLMRCGPPILANGSLDFGTSASPSSSAEAILSYNTTLRQLSLTPSPRAITYTIDFRSLQGGLEFSGEGRAWAQSSVIQIEG